MARLAPRILGRKNVYVVPEIQEELEKPFARKTPQLATKHERHFVLPDPDNHCGFPAAELAFPYRSHNSGGERWFQKKRIDNDMSLATGPDLSAPRFATYEALAAVQ